MATYEEAVDEEFLTRLRRYVRRRVPTPHDADDLVQDVFVSLLKKGTAVAPASARAWLFTVARHRVLDRWRSRRKVVPLEAEPLAPRDPEEAEDVAYLARCLDPMLASLNGDDRLLLRRVDVEDRPQAEIARESGVAPSVVRSRVQRARRRLRGLLEGCCAVEKDGRGQPVGYEHRPGKPCPCTKAE